MCAKHSNMMPQGEGKIEPLNGTRSGRVHPKILNISTEIPEIQKHKEASEVTKAKALEYLQNNCPSKLWCHVYTDGSAKDATRNGGSGVYIKYPDTTYSSHSFAVGKLASNFRAELQAVREATNILIERNITTSNIIILSDCRAALQSLQPEARDEVVEIIFQNLGQLQTNHILALQWIVAHCGLFGHEETDRLAKERSSKPQPPAKISFQETKTLLKIAPTKHGKTESTLSISKTINTTFLETFSQLYFDWEQATAALMHTCTD